MTEKDKHCRVCLKIKNNVCSIYEYKKNEYLPNVIYNISGVKILQRLEPKAQICQQCAVAVVIAQKIIIQCQESEEYLDTQKQKQQRLQREESESASKYEQNVPSLLTKSEVDYDSESYNAEEEEGSVYIDYETMQYADTEDVKEEEEEVSDSVDKDYDEAMKEEDDENDENKVDSTTDMLCSEELTTTIESLAFPAIKRRRRRQRDPIKTPHFDCDLCDFNTKTGKRLVEHRRDAHDIDDPNIYCCTLCPQKFSWKPTLYRHIQLDHKKLPDDKKFICSECGKAYTRLVHLSEHTKQIHGPRRFKCADPNCKQTFTRAFTLRRHYLAAHSNNTPYHCADCDKYFKIYDLWKYHNEVVHRNETVYCPRCGYPFRFKEKLEEHLQKNACKKSVIPCPYCQRRFTAKTGLKEHLKNIHHIELDKETE